MKESPAAWYCIIWNDHHRRWNYEWWNYGVLFQLSSESIILDGSSERCHKILCWNSHLDTAKYRGTTLEKVLKFSIECVSTTVSYEYQRVNGIIYLTINSVSRGSNDTCIFMWNGSYSCRIYSHVQLYKWTSLIHRLFQNIYPLETLRVRKRWKSHGPKFSEYGGCGNTSLWKFFKRVVIWVAECACVLSCKRMTPFDNPASCFWWHFSNASGCQNNNRH